MSSDLYNRFFVYSQQQADMKIKIEKTIGKTPKFGTVTVNGSPRKFTDILVSMSDSKFSDSTILIAGDIRKIKYTEPS